VKKKIFIFGANGNLGKYLTVYLKDKYNIFSDKNLKKKINSKNIETIKKLLTKCNPDTVINLIAKTNVDECEKKKKLAKMSNYIIPKNITKNIEQKKCHLIHLSTDQLYNGGKNLKNLEKKINPINYYAYSKFLGEKEASKFKKSTILRTNFIGINKVKNKKSLSDWIVKSVKEKKNINTYSNIIFSPLYIKTLCKFIDMAIKKRIYGIYNLGSKNSISKYNFSILLCKYLNLDTTLIKKKNYINNLVGAKRPLNMSLDVRKFEKDFKINLPYVRNEIKLTAKDYYKKIN
jgi:dTDP-4-dehydrorhamnose reductase